ncbi:MAG: hypothetical protein CFE37_10060 [Alphaproteobacteria bacterium PA4]|nr:MAG: hypothetical protein CFE37_10060 [Alphaproteobacteria bacterium PA4]
MAVQSQIGFQFSENFEGYADGPLDLDYSYVPPTPTFRLTGGAIRPGSPATPARSGTRVYASDGLITLTDIGGFADYFYSASVFVSGSSPITFKAFAYPNSTNPFVLTSPTNARNHGFSYGNADLPPGELPRISRIEISAAAPFAIDDLVIGQPSAFAPIPEPASWALLVTGFGLVGGGLRARRRQANILAAPV